MTVDPHAPLDYEHRTYLRPLTNTALKVAFVAGALPLVAGGAITIAYVFTWWSPLQTAGVFCIVGGLVSVLVGAMALVSHCIERRRRRLLIPPSVWVLSLLIVANFPVCGLCMRIGTGLMNHFDVLVINQTSVPVTNLSICMTNIGQNTSRTVTASTIAPGAQLVCDFTPPDEATVTGSATIGGTPVQFQIDGYVCHGLGPKRRTVTFTSPATQPTIK